MKIQIGELQAALAASASLNSWLEAQGTEASGVIATGMATDGSLGADGIAAKTEDET